MKNTSILFGFLLLSGFFIFNSCGRDDLPPDIYLLDSNSEITQQSDTTVLLFTKYTDPGIKAEDNVTEEANIIKTDDSEDELEVTADGYLKRVEDIVITYTATDEALNVGTKTRNISIRNISEPFAGVYMTTRTAMFIEDETTYNSTVSVDTRIPGRLGFPKSYSHIDTETSIYFKVVADLFNPEASTVFSEIIAYMGTVSDKELPFFKDMTYTEGMEAALDFNLLMISAQTFTDALGNAYTISGVADPINPDLPLSRIEYLSGTKTIKRIILELNVTKDGVYTDRVTEIYTPL
jgi:hypothetical protein